MPLKTIINGIDVDRQRASGTAGPLSAGSAPAVCTEWIGGTQTRTAVQAAGGVAPDRTFSIYSDYPEPLLGSGTAPSPIETLVAAVGSSFVTSFVLAAAAADVRIEWMRVRAAASFDDHTAPLTQQTERPPANLLLVAEMDAAASLADLHHLCAIAIERAPVIALCRLNLRVQIEPVEGSTP